MKKYFLPGLCSVFLVAGIILPLGCGKIGSTEEKVTIEVQMFSGPEYNAMVPTAEYWNEHYSVKTGITVNVTDLNRVGYFSKLETQLIAGLPFPDIVHPFSMHLGRLHEYLEPLNKYIEDKEMMVSPDGTLLSINNILDTAMETVMKDDGELYMIPKDLSEVILYYRKDLLPRPPETWDEYVETAKKFTRSINPGSPTKYGAVMQGKYEMWTFCAALECIWPYGANILDPVTGMVGFEGPGAVSGLSIYEDLSRSGVLPTGSINAEYPEVAASVMEGEVAMAMMWNAFYAEMTANKGKYPEVLEKFDIAPPPGVKRPDGKIKRDMYIQTIGLAINKSSVKKEAAARFMLWAALGEGAVIYADAGGSSPVKDVWEKSNGRTMYSKIGPWVKEFGRALPIDEKITDIVMIGSSWVQKIIAGGSTAEQAVRGFNDEVRMMLEEKEGLP